MSKYFHGGRDRPLEDEIFVFGSNLQGIHGKGAAKDALNLYGAKKGKSHGLQGKSFAIPTRTIAKSSDGGSQFVTLPLDVIEIEVKRFIQFTLNNPELKFFVTPLGTGLAGHKHKEIAPMFKEAINCRFSKEWEKYLEGVAVTSGSLVIAGSRGITDFEYLKYAYKEIGFEATEIVSGMARGVDTLAIWLAKELNLPLKEFPADWDRYEKRAGFLRNEDMGKYADAGLILWDGQSKGTLHMKSVLSRLEKPHWVFEYPSKEYNRHM